jgi:hypothetical protein
MTRSLVTALATAITEPGAQKPTKQFWSTAS